MKIKLLTDLHMEGQKYYYTWDGEDVLFLGGDIHNKNRHYELLDQIPMNVEVYMVAGNHEYYDGDFDKVNKYLTNLQKEYTNFNFLNNNAGWLQDGTAVFGGTMFTDFMLHGTAEKWFAEHRAKDYIADFTYITKDGRAWAIEDHKEQHDLFVEKLCAWKKHTEGKRRIVLTHFMPTELGGDIRFANNALNPYFTVNMHQYMYGIDYWFCGHGHSNRDVTIEDTRVIMNPRGYRHENDGYFNPNLLLEI